jgi:hypothetical protein
MDQEGDDIDEPIKQHVERNERVIVKLLNLKIICCYLECSVCVSHGTRKVKDNFKQQEYDLSLDAYIFLFLLFDPLDLCNFFQDDGQHAQPCENNHQIECTFDHFSGQFTLVYIGGEGQHN